MLVVLTAAATAHGRQPPVAVDEPEARQLSDQGLESYRRGEYDQAIDRFKEAYVLSRLPDLLYDLAQAYRRKGDCAHARSAYRSYLEFDPAAYNRPRVEERVLEMQRCEAPMAPAVPTARETPATLAPSERLLPVAVQAPPAPLPRRRLALRVSGLLAIAAGLTLGAVGVYYSVEAASAHLSQINRLYRDGGQWDDRYRQLENSGQGDTTTAAALYSAVEAGASVVTGATLVWLGWRRAQ